MFITCAERQLSPVDDDDADLVILVTLLMEL